MSKTRTAPTALRKERKALLAGGVTEKKNPANDQYKLDYAHRYYDAMQVSFGIQSPELKVQAVLRCCRQQFGMRRRIDNPQSPLLLKAIPRIKTVCLTVL
jgi:hypothetical protein